MPKDKKSEKRIKKEAYWKRLQNAAREYENCLFVDANNVSSKQIGTIRQRLRTIGATMIMGKNTLMKASLNALNSKPSDQDCDYESRGGAEWTKNDNIEKILLQLKGNTNIIFTNGDLTGVKQILDTEVRPSPAKTGMIAPDDVWIKAGKTGLDPRNTGFFQNLNIQTKIKGGQVEIVVPK